MLLNLHKGYDRSDTALYKADNVLTAEEDVYADQARVAGAGIDPRMELESAGASLTVNWTLAPRLSLTSISAYEHFTRLHAEDRSEEHTSELQSLMRISYAVFCLKKKKEKK